jgi:hypothetical protein
MIATSYPLLDVLLWMLEFFLFILWIFLIVSIFTDVLRSSDLTGVGKFAWILLVIIVPFLGAFIYLIARGDGMHDRAVRQAQQQEQAFRQYVSQATPESTPTDQLAKLADLKERGAINEEEYQRAKAKILD